MSLSQVEVMAEMIQEAIDYGRDNGVSDGEIEDVLTAALPSNEDPT